MPFRSLFDPIKDVTAVDDYTVKYQLKAPFAPFAQLISTMLPVSPKAAEPYDGNKLSRNPVGAGSLQAGRVGQGRTHRAGSQ